MYIRQGCAQYTMMHTCLYAECPAQSIWNTPPGAHICIESRMGTVMSLTYPRNIAIMASMTRQSLNNGQINTRH